MAKTPKNIKWTYLRVLRATHDAFAKLAQQLDRPMAWLADDAVLLLSRRKVRLMQEALAFYLLYCDGEPMYIVAARDEKVAVEGFRKAMLGVVSFKKIEAKPCVQVPLDDFTRIALLSMLRQLGEINGIMQAAMAQASAVQGPHLVKPM